MPRKSLLILGLIVFLGMILRLYRLSLVPAGLHFDEAIAGYNAFLIQKDRVNTSGEVLPINIDTFGDYRPAMVSYLSAPFVSLLGLSILTTRLPNAIFGVVLVCLTYVLAKLIFQKESLSQLAAFLVAISPMALIFARSTTEGHIDIVWEVAAIITLLLSIKKRSVYYLLLVYLFWVLGYFTYHTSRLLTPLMAMGTIGFAYLHFRPGKQIFFASLLTLFVFILFPLLFFLLTPFGQGRFRQVSVFSFPEVQRSLDELIREDGHNGNIFITRLLHNKVTSYSLDVATRYSNFFSPNVALFSFTQPDRYFVPQTGANTLLEFFALILALGTYIYRKNATIFYLPLLLLFLAPLPSALTFEASPNYLRAIFLSPFWQLVGAFGLTHFLILTKGKVQKILIVFIVTITVTQQFYFLHQYFIHQTARVPQSRNSEMEKLATYLYRNNNQGKKILLSERAGPYIYYLFFNSLDVFSRNVVKSGKYFTGDFKIDNLTFSKNECPNTNDLLFDHYDIVIFKDYCPKPTWSGKIDEFRRADGSVASEARVLDEKVYVDFLSRLKLAQDQENRIKIIKEVEDSFVK